MEALREQFGAACARALSVAAPLIVAQPFVAGLVAGGAVLLLLHLGWHACCARPKSRRGFGSGENAFWNRRIRTDRPVHRSKHHKLEHTW